MKKKNLKGLSLDELRRFVEALGQSRYRAKQLFSWIYEKHADSFSEMSDLSEDFRATLAKTATLEHLTINKSQTSPSDGTTKILFGLHDGSRIESVLIPPDVQDGALEKRLTLCASTQVGCPLNCAFCATGSMGFTRNLSAGEIVDQVIQAQKLSTRRITNLVFMGMGEPMLNYDNVITAIGLLNHEQSMNISARHITISTAGYPDQIRRLSTEPKPVKLALSLHSLVDEKRSALMPLNRKYPIGTLIGALTDYWKRTRRRPTFEYILFDGFNDTPDDVKRLIEVSKAFPSKINLIPFHSIASIRPSGFAATLRPSPAARIQDFARKLRDAKLTVMVRRSAGQDIDAACGQLAVKETNSMRKNVHLVSHPSSIIIDQET